jgi:hypothetical protein
MHANHRVPTLGCFTGVSSSSPQHLVDLPGLAATVAQLLQRGLTGLCCQIHVEPTQPEHRYIGLDELEVPSI